MAMWESIGWILLQITCALPFSFVCASQVLYGILVFYTERYPKRPITSKNKQNSTRYSMTLQTERDRERQELQAKINKTEMGGWGVR